MKCVQRYRSTHFIPRIWLKWFCKERLNCKLGPTENPRAECDTYGLADTASCKDHEMSIQWPWVSNEFLASSRLNGRLLQPCKNVHCGFPPHSKKFIYFMQTWKGFRIGKLKRMKHWITLICIRPPINLNNTIWSRQVKNHKRTTTQQNLVALALKFKWSR